MGENGHGANGASAATVPKSGLRERAVSWIINRAVKFANSRHDIGALQQKYNAFQARIVRVRVTDINQEWFFRVLNGNFEILSNPPRVDGGLDVTSDVLVGLAAGKRKMQDPATGRQYEAPYSPIVALTHGELNVWGEAASNDVVLFAKGVYADVYPDIQKALASGGPGVLP